MMYIHSWQQVGIVCDKDIEPFRPKYVNFLPEEQVFNIPKLA
jgi:hypothetical protein